MSEEYLINPAKQYYGQPAQPGFNDAAAPPAQSGFAQSGFATSPAYGHIDPESGFTETKGFGFTDESIRKGFIKKVYSILSVQLTVTGIMITIFLKTESLNEWAQQNPSLMWVGFFIIFAVLIAMSCSETIRRQSPINYIFLGIFTLGQAFLLGVIAGTYNSDEVLLAVIITAVVCLGLTIFAFQTRWDFTVMGGVLFVALIILIVFGFISIFFPGKTVTLIYASVGALIFCIYLIYDTQLMMGGSHKYSISPEEYIFAALNLYLDILNLFLFILRIIGVSKK